MIDKICGEEMHLLNVTAWNALSKGSYVIYSSEKNIYFGRSQHNVNSRGECLLFPSELSEFRRKMLFKDLPIIDKCEIISINKISNLDAIIVELSDEKVDKVYATKSVLNKKEGDLLNTAERIIKYYNGNIKIKPKLRVLKKPSDKDRLKMYCDEIFFQIE